MIKKALLTGLLLLFVLCVSHSTALSADPPSCKHFVGSCGDTDGDYIISISDVVYLINYIFTDGPAPENEWAGDCDLNGMISISDAVYLISYIFMGGPAPCAGTGDNKLTQQSPFLDCIEYTYDGAGLVTFRHVNSAFNCCPELIDVYAYRSGGTIYVIESEVPNPAGPCPCMCLYDLDFSLTGVPAGSYRIYVDEVYVSGSMEPLDFTVTLSSAISGHGCVLRDSYPWGNPWK